MTLSHPHGQIYGYPHITPRTDRMLQSCDSYRRETGRNLFDDMLDSRARRPGADSTGRDLLDGFCALRRALAV